MKKIVLLFISILFLYPAVTSANFGNSLDTGLIHGYSFDSNSDDLVGVLNGTENSVTRSTSYGKVNSGLYFDSGSSKVSFASTDMFAGTFDFSFSFWIKYTSGLFFVSRRDGVPPDFQFLENGGPMYLQLGYVNMFYSSGITLDSSWHMVTVTRHGSEFKLYLDSTLVSTDYSSASIASGHMLTIGDTNDSTSLGAVMYFDNFFIWDRYLTSSEVTTLYNSGSGLDYSAIVVVPTPLFTPPLTNYFEFASSTCIEVSTTTPHSYQCFATSTNLVMSEGFNSIVLALGIFLVLMFVIFIGFVWNSINKKKPWY